jgi:hypothetical protein
MPKRALGLTLDPKGEDFILRRTNAAGRTVSMTLSEDNVLTLAQSAQRLQDHILVRRSRSGAGHGSTRS